MGSSLVAEFVKGINAEDENAKSAFINIISACLTTIKNKYYEFQSTGETVMTNFIGGVKAKEYETKSAFSAIVDSSIEEIRSNYERFHQAGAYLVEDLQMVLLRIPLWLRQKQEQWQELLQMPRKMS